MFKIGDKVYCKDNNKYGITRDCTGIILLINNITRMVLFKIYIHKQLDYIGSEHWIEMEVLKSIKRPTTEIEYLDAFKENFKDGV